ncbi:MAG: DUF4250 domain-containing protein [Eubacteriales bacterium]|nr:DUF4250 domain-containing protein [Eubacteriales bacterium]
MGGLPMDPIMLSSVLNTKLRDQYKDFDQLCDDLQLNKEEILDKLKAVGFEYMPEINQFR